jgi:hypothetical protein
MTDSTTLSRRNLLSRGSAACAAALALPAAAQAARSATQTCVLNGLQPVVLTISGPGIEANRGKLQAAGDRMLITHGYRFDAAWSCGLDALNSLEQHTLRTALEYDEAEHRLRGPLLEHVLQAAGLDLGQALAQDHWLTLQGIDGYRSRMPLAQALRWRMLLATQLDGLPLAMGGLGPLWSIYAPQQIAELGQLPLKERFQAAVWGLYYMEVGARPPAG